MWWNPLDDILSTDTHSDKYENSPHINEHKSFCTVNSEHLYKVTISETPFLHGELYIKHNTLHEIKKKHVLHPEVSWYHPCLWPNVRLGLLIWSTDAEFSQIIVSTSLKFSSWLHTQFEIFNGSTSVTQAADPEGVSCTAALQLFCEAIETEARMRVWVQESCFRVVTCSILQGGAVGPVSDWQGVDLREGGTWWQAVLLDGTGASRALLPVCIVKLLFESKQCRKKSKYWCSYKYKTNGSLLLHNMVGFSRNFQGQTMREQPFWTNDMLSASSTTTLSGQRMEA